MTFVAQEHLSVALALSLPIVVVVTKVDMTPAPIYEQTCKQLAKVLRSPGCRKKPVFVSSSLSSVAREAGNPDFTVYFLGQRRRHGS